MSLFTIFKSKPIVGKPNSAKAEILFELITKGSISQKTFGWMGGYRTRISDLRLKHDVVLSSKLVTDYNKHGNEYRYKVHSLDKENRQHAIDVYNKINEPKLKSRIFDCNGKALGTTNFYP